MLTWLAELMKHRDAADSKRYRVLAAKFIAKYGIDASDYDIIKGWRANASYFYIAKEFVRVTWTSISWRNCCRLAVWESSIASRPQRRTGNCEKSRRSAFRQLQRIQRQIQSRDVEARQNMRDLIDSDANTVTNVFSTLL